MIDGAPSLVNFPTQELLRRQWSSCVSSSLTGLYFVDAGAPKLHQCAAPAVELPFLFIAEG